MIKFDYIESYENSIPLPTRSTSGASGYDFYCPERVHLIPGVPTLIKTGVRFVTDEQVWLACMPRSGMGFKYGLRLLNTLGNIDSDYQFADNGGHIMAKVVVDKELVIEQGDRFMQGVILPYFVVDGDDTKGLRHGGMGSTGN